MKLSEEISQKRWNFGWNFRENDELVIDDTLDFLKRLFDPTSGLLASHTLWYSLRYDG